VEGMVLKSRGEIDCCVGGTREDPLNRNENGEILLVFSIGTNATDKTISDKATMLDCRTRTSLMADGVF
jgi:hypothetical protein